jgi:hypothetical protein
MKKKPLIAVGIAAALVIGALVLSSVILFTLNPIVPTDTKIANVLAENEAYLLGIDGVVGAGIARNESNNYIIGIAVYVEDNLNNAQGIPSELGGFKVFVKTASGTNEADMLIQK